MTRATPVGALLAPYLPRLAATWPRERSWLLADGSLVFADISGFTALSEKLAAKGRHGTEELTSILDRCFTTLLGVAHAEGAELLKFGGDALLLHLDGADHATRACRAAQWMQAALRRIRAGEDGGPRLSLRMSIGIHSGEVALFRVGSRHEELVITGPAATVTAETEARASAGQIALSPATAAAIDPAWIRGPERLLRPARNLAAPTSTQRPAFPVRADALNAIPTALREPFLTGGGEPEHRTATIAFVHFDGTDDLLLREGPDRLALALDELMRDVQDAADEHEVTFLATDISADGGKAILAAGVPRTHPDDDGRLLHALRQIADRERALQIRIGAHRGHVFAGEIGPADRRTYTVIGDTVNLAARLMAAAPSGRILATERVLAGSRTRFLGEPLPPMRVKGKSAPVHAFEVGAPTGSRTTGADESLPFVGRDAELEQLLAAYGRACNDVGTAVTVSSGTGLGKGRLVRELLARVPDAQRRIVFCDEYEQATPFFAIRILIRLAIGIGADESPSPFELRERLEARAPSTVAHAALLADVLGIDPAPLETPETSRMGRPQRSAWTAIAVQELLTQVHRKPTVFVFEDAHWMDAASAAIVERLAEGIRERPWLLLETREAADDAPDDDDARLRIVLRPLDRAALRALVDDATEAAPLTPQDRDAIIERSDGNPMFLAELLSAIQQPEMAGGLPDRIETLIASEIDRLASRERTLLRTAAILGGAFELPLLSTLLDTDDGSLRAALAPLDRFLDVDARGIVRFRHRSHRDVAYERLPYQQRRALHARAADVIEERNRSTGSEALEVLSLHHLHARRYDRCWESALAAAERAQRRSANAEAVELYERALLAARAIPEVADDATRATVLERLGDAANLAGFLDRADAAYRSALSLRRDAPRAAAALWWKRARLASRRGHTTLALRRASLGITAVAEDASPEAASLRANLHVLAAWLKQQQGHPRQARARCELVLEQAVDGRAVADALLLLDWIHLDLGQPELATNAERALAILEELGEFEELGVALNNLGGYAYFRGEWSAAIGYYGRARAAFERIGDTLHAALADLNAAELLIDQGREDEAEPLLVEIVRLWRSLGFVTGIPVARAHLARIALARGSVAHARELFEEARLAFAAQGRTAKTIELDVRLAACDLAEQQPDAALTRADDALRRHRASGGTEMLSSLHRVRAEALRCRGALDAAARAAADAIAAARARTSPFDLALSLRAADRIARDLGQPAVDLDGEAERVFAQLGVRAATTTSAAVG